MTDRLETIVDMAAAVRGLERGVDDPHRLAVIRTGLRVRYLRQAKAMSQAQLADAAGVTQAQVSRVESGRSTPRIDALMRLAAALDTPLTELLDP